MQNRHILHFCSDQSVCGSCWSFGTTGTIEGAYFLKYGHQVRLSQQVRFIVTFFWFCDSAALLWIEGLKIKAVVCMRSKWDNNHIQ